jgi:hypothetical protein
LPTLQNEKVWKGRKHEVEQGKEKATQHGSKERQGTRKNRMREGYLEGPRRKRDKKKQTGGRHRLLAT